MTGPRSLVLLSILTESQISTYRVSGNAIGERSDRAGRRAILSQTVIITTLPQTPCRGGGDYYADERNVR